MTRLNSNSIIYQMKVAIVHDQLQEFGGAERVLISLINIFPDADVYTSFYNPKSLGTHSSEINKRQIITSWADKIPFLKKIYSPLRFITPLLWKYFNFSKYDLVISSSGAYMSKGIITKGKTLHICYLHHPPRYLYNYETAIEWQKYLLVRIYAYIVNHNLRIYDFESSQRVDYFIANSEETSKRIQKFYRRNAKVIYPPVTVPPSLSIDNKNKGYYLTVSRLARAKHIEVLIHASNKKGFQLKIVGRGRDETYLRSIAGQSVEFLGNIPDDNMGKIYKGAKAFLFASVDEEFGIAPVEAMGQGVPVIAYKSGGVPETVKDKYNGYLYNQLDSDSLIHKIDNLEKLTKEEYENMKINARSTALRFCEDNFKTQFLEFISSIRK